MVVVFHAAPAPSNRQSTVPRVIAPVLESKTTTGSSSDEKIISSTITEGDDGVGEGRVMRGFKKLGFYYGKQ